MPYITVISMSGHPDSREASLAELDGRLQAEYEAVESLLSERCEIVERAVMRGGEYNGMSVMSLIGNTCPVDGLSVNEIDEQIKQALMTIIFNPSSPSLYKQVEVLGSLLRKQVTAQVKEAVWLDESRIRESFRDIYRAA